MRRWKIACVALVAALALAGCASGDDDSSSATTSGGGSATTGTASGPAPGVTADTIKVGVTYVDTKALAAVNLNYNLGDYEADLQGAVRRHQRQGRHQRSEDRADHRAD